MNDYLHFYGSDNLKLFEIERSAMDCQGLVIDHLDCILPHGRVADVGAGCGFTANRLQNTRTITCIEPSDTLPNLGLPLAWVKATAETMPFHSGYFDAAYSTWAYFLPGISKEKGLQAVTHCIKNNGIFIVVENAGGDEFSSYAPTNIVSEKSWYLENGFTLDIIETHFKFDTLESSAELMTFYFGEEKMKGHIRLEYSYNVAVYTKKIVR